MPNLMSVVCGLPDLGPASCVAYVSSVQVHVIVGRGGGFLWMVLVEPGLEKNEVREKASAFCFKISILLLFVYA